MRKLEEFFSASDLKSFVAAVGDDGGFTEMDQFKAEEIVAHCNRLLREWVDKNGKHMCRHDAPGREYMVWEKQPPEWADFIRIDIPLERK